MYYAANSDEYHPFLKAMMYSFDVYADLFVSSYDEDAGKGRQYARALEKPLKRQNLLHCAASVEAFQNCVFFARTWS